MYKLVKKINLKKTFSLIFLMAMVSVSSILIYKSLTEVKTIKAAGGPNADTLDLFDWNSGVAYPNSGYGIKEYIDYKAANRPTPAGSIGAIAQITYDVYPKANSNFYPDLATCQSALPSGNSNHIDVVIGGANIKQIYDPNNIATLIQPSGGVYALYSGDSESGIPASCSPGPSNYFKYSPIISCPGYSSILMSYSRVDRLSGTSFGWLCNSSGNETESTSSVNSWPLCITWYCRKN